MQSHAVNTASKEVNFISWEGWDLEVTDEVTSEMAGKSGVYYRVQKTPPRFAYKVAEPTARQKIDS